MSNKARWGRATSQDDLVGGLWMRAQAGRRRLPELGENPWVRDSREPGALGLSVSGILGTVVPSRGWGAP